MVAGGQPDVVFICDRDMAAPERTGRLVNRTNPGRVVRITGDGRYRELPVSRERGTGEPAGGEGGETQ